MPLHKKRRVGDRQMSSRYGGSSQTRSPSIEPLLLLILCLIVVSLTVSVFRSFAALSRRIELGVRKSFPEWDKNEGLFVSFFLKALFLLVFFLIIECCKSAVQDLKASFTSEENTLQHIMEINHKRNGSGMDSLLNKRVMFDRRRWRFDEKAWVSVWEQVGGI